MSEESVLDAALTVVSPMDLRGNGMAIFSKATEMLWSCGQVSSTNEKKNYVQRFCPFGSKTFIWYKTGKDLK